MDENGGFVHRKCNAYNGGKVSEIDRIERIELFEVIEFDGTFQLAAPSQDVFFDWQVWDSFLLLVGGILGYNITYNIYHNRIKMVSQDRFISPNTHRIWWTHLSWVVSTVFSTVAFRRNKHGILKPSQNCRNPESWYSGVFEYIEH